MIKELISETLGYGCFDLKLYRLRRDGSSRPAFRHVVTYQIEVNGQVMHSNVSAEDAMSRLVVYLNSITQQLSKENQVAKV